MGTKSSTRFNWSYLDIAGLQILILQEMFFKVWWTCFEDGTLIPFFNHLHFEGPTGTVLINHRRSCSRNALYSERLFYSSLSPLSLAPHALAGLAPQAFGVNCCSTVCLLLQTSCADGSLVPPQCACPIAAGFHR